MRLYFAGIERGVFAKSEFAHGIYEECIKAGVEFALTSYFYLKKDPSYINSERRIKHLFLDSGAFSAHHSKAHIDLDDYIKFIKEHEKRLDVYAGLDVIGSAEETYTNQQIMEKAGLHPLPTFHFGEDFKWLDLYLNAGYKYIAIGGLVGKPNRPRCAFLKRCFEKIPNNIKTHGYGMTSPKLIRLFPFYSVDSINWLMGEMRGTLYQYDRGNIKPMKLSKRPSPNTGEHMAADRWNIHQWKKYQEHLLGVGP